MEINLTEKEKQELEKRGFYVKPWKNFTASGIFFSIPLSLIIWVVIFAISYGMFHKFFLVWICYIFSIIPSILIYITILRQFAFNLKSFYSTKNNSIISTFLDSDANLIKRKNDFSDYDPTILWILGTGLYIFLFITTKTLIIQNELLTTAFLLDLFLYKISGLVFIGIIYTSKFFRNNPLYVFGNIGMKIQELTPEIEKQSQMIQTGFEKEQNFAVLHSGFEKLSSTFSRIVELVVKLEKIEARANKGNLFDSAKYIGSLRTDIVTPLVELRKFLESQREQLVESQKELSRVRVGGDRSLEGNAELQSKRSESLLQELDTNIGKLGEMITKLS